MNTFFIFGYGVPKDILSDSNYRTYLTLCFNAIFDAVANRPARIVFCGGKTSFAPPYNRSEAGEMKRLFTAFAKSRAGSKKADKRWEYHLVDWTLSSVENVMEAKVFCVKYGCQKASIFCEHTRAPRVRALVGRVFGKQKAVVMPIDFDTSDRRYDQSFVKKREKDDLRVELRALKNLDALREWREKKEAMLVKKMSENFKFT